MKMHYHFLYGSCFFSGHPVQKIIVVLESYFLSGAQVGFCADVLQCAKSLKRKKHFKSILKEKSMLYNRNVSPVSFFSLLCT